MSELKRRKLGQGKNQGQRPQQNNRPQQNSNPQRQQGQGQNQNPNPSHGQRPQRGQGNNNRPQGGNQGPHRGQQRHHRPTPKPPPPPPAYMQRDLLLMAKKDPATGVDQVRAKFDPLSTKLPLHVSLVLPEPSQKIGSDFLKDISKADLPAVNEITFSQIIVHDDMYLWLTPDEQGFDSLCRWRNALVEKVKAQNPDHTQEETFHPHITLGYIPRSMTPEEAVEYARGLIALPLKIQFENILLEEFSENQVSNSIDTLALS